MLATPFVPAALINVMALCGLGAYIVVTDKRESNFRREYDMRRHTQEKDEERRKNTEQQHIAGDYDRVEQKIITVPNRKYYLRQKLDALNKLIAEKTDKDHETSLDTSPSLTSFSKDSAEKAKDHASLVSSPIAIPKNIAKVEGHASLVPSPISIPI
jgi:hypothetical protein